MFGNILEQFKNPVTTIIEKSEEEDTKKGIIKLAIISAIMSLINIISSIASIISKYSKNSYWYSSYSSSELWEKRWEAIKDAELLSGFFKTWVIIAIAIAVGALILFIIAKIVKSPKEYSSNLSMVNNILIIYIVGSIINLILSLIYAPLGWLILYATIVYASLTLVNAYRDSLNVESTDKLVLATTGVLTGLIVILVIIISSISGVSLSDLTSITKLLNF